MDSSKYIYALHVAQQPQRARMCGFGDKDRRPITPPPCVRLSITDRATMKEVDVSTLDISFFVLTVDLWDEHAQTELNLVVHPSSSSQAPLTGTYQNVATAAAAETAPRWSDARSVAPDQQQHPYQASTEGSAVQHRHTNPAPGMISSVEKSFPARSDGSAYERPAEEPASQSRRVSASQQTPGSFTRNLIGSLVASAFKLNDMQDELGIWFVLQDLSVRTEGTFRLKFNFVDLSTGSQSLLTSGSAPVLCSGFSNPFSVFSAKRFPGMIESTDISRKFSNQGIKIPVRKAEN